ncbi:MFS general substrate transporter, partial [Macrolepiota fuliginosa MF-IS2]
VAPILVGVFLSAMDNTIVVSSYGAIGSYFDELEKTSWIATAYLLTVASFQPLYGKLSDIFGRKSCLLFAYTMFAIGCALCGSSRSMNMLIACRSLAGIGGGGMATLASIIISDLVPLRSRGTWQGLMNIVWSCGNTAGASLGGYLADTIGWRWGFLIQLPLAVTSGLSVYFFLQMPTAPLPSTTSTTTLTNRSDSILKTLDTFKSKIRRVDFAGAVALVFAVFSLLFGLDRGGNVGWNNPITISSLVCFGIFFIIFGFIEGRFASEPFAPPRLIFNRSLFASYLTNFFSVATSFGQLFHISLYFQTVLGKSASVTGAWFVIVIAADLMSSLICGVVIQTTGKYYFVSLISYIILLGGVVTVSGGTGLLGLRGSMGEIIAGLAVTAFGYGGGITTSLVSLIANVDKSDQAVATAAVTYFFRSLGSVVGLSIGSTLVQTTLRSTLRHTLQGKDADELTKHVRESLAYLKSLDTETREIVRAAYVKAIQSTLIFYMSLALAAIIVSLFMVEKQLAR